MGTWGEAIFSDDTAQDIRDEWIDAFRATASAKKATAEVRKSSRDAFKDPDEGPVATLALALTLWKYGVLDASTKRDALAVISKKKGLDLWEEQGPAAVRARLKEYDKAKAKLLSKQPPSKEGTFKPKKPKDCGLKVGDVFSVPLPRPRRARAYYWVVATRRDLKMVAPIVRLLRASGVKNPQDWQNAPTETLRDFEEFHDPNRRHEFGEVYFYKPTDEMNEAKVKLEGSRQLSKGDAPGARRLNPAFADAWDRLGLRAEKSLDQSHWLTSDELFHLCQDRTPAQIATLRTQIADARKKGGKVGGCVHAAAERLVVEHGEYARAHALLSLWKKVRRDAFLNPMLWSHILLGIGQAADAQKWWRGWLFDPSAEDSDPEVQWMRDHVAAKQAGRPLPKRSKKR